VLFLDELPEFGHQALEVLRQPLEDGVVSIGRARGTISFPARFMLVGAMNPCPCGYSGDPARACACPEAAVQRLGLSARAYHRVLKVARTVADLGGAEAIGPAHLAEAIQYQPRGER
jgi:predicted ATPase with chaperone activity